jgi:hypothetical protein
MEEHSEIFFVVARMFEIRIDSLLFPFNFVYYVT